MATDPDSLKPVFTVAVDGAVLGSTSCYRPWWMKRPCEGAPLQPGKHVMHVSREYVTGGMFCGVGVLDYAACLATEAATGNQPTRRKVEGDLQFEALPGHKYLLKAVSMNQAGVQYQLNDTTTGSTLQAGTLQAVRQ